VLPNGADPVAGASERVPPAGDLAGIATLCTRAFGAATRSPGTDSSGSESSQAHRLAPQAAADHLDRLVRAAMAICGSRQLAEELVQETYVKVLSRPRFVRRDGDLAYLLRALRNTWYKHLRSQAKGEESSLSARADEPASPRRLADPELSLEAAAVLDAVAALPGPFREVIAAVDLAGLDYGQAARALGIRKGTVMSRLYRARERVAVALDDERRGGDGDRSPSPGFSKEGSQR
jgi:RNA polymerase sigma-70 factor (ECF subfamily)